MAEETALEMADRHVAEGRKTVTAQRVIIAQLRQNGLPTAAAEETLRIFESTLAIFESHERELG